MLKFNCRIRSCDLELSLPRLSRFPLRNTLIGMTKNMLRKTDTGLKHFGWRNKFLPKSRNRAEANLILIRGENKIEAILY